MIFRKLCFVCFTTYILNNETMHRSALSKAADTRSRNLYQNLVQDILYQKLASVSVNLAPDFSCTRILNWIERSSISMQHLATTWLKSRDVIVWQGGLFTNGGKQRSHIWSQSIAKFFSASFLVQETVMKITSCMILRQVFGASFSYKTSCTRFRYKFLERVSAA